MKLVVASNNKHKLSEFKRILTPLGYKVLSQKEAHIDLEVEETGETFEENASLKAKQFFEIAKTAVISDDSGLCVDYLDGAPGIYSARFGGENATDKDRCNKLLDELGETSLDHRSARFVCVIHLIVQNGEEYSFRGECEGYIGNERMGNNGFGYDPIFMVGDKSFAQLSDREKDRISHRGQALKKLQKFLISQQN